MTAVTLTDVTKQYGNVTALAGVSLSIEEGEMVAVVGASGSGKSTLLHLAGTLDRATSGTVDVCGLPVGQLSDSDLSTLRAARIGFVFQQFHLNPYATAVESVSDGLLYAGVTRRQRLKVADSALDQVGLANRRTHRPHQLSGGERQRVAIARAIIGKPELLFADEPTGNLDSVSGANVMSILRALHDAGTTVVIITHDHEIASGVPRQIRLRDGQLEMAT